MSLVKNNALAAAAAQNKADSVVERSLRLRSSASAYLSRTPASAGNLKTWTWSAWVKRSKIDANGVLLMAGASGNSNDFVYVDLSGSNYFRAQIRTGGTTRLDLQSAQVFRDPSAWYHLVFILDLNNATQADRFRMYVNGGRITSFSTNTNSLDNTQSPQVNNTVLHYISNNTIAAGDYFDGYLTEINFIDGQALDPTYFGEYNSITGVWQQHKYRGTYGTNGFYLPFMPTTQARGFNTVLYTGNGSTQSITDVGFSPDLIWMKSRTSAVSHVLIDSLRGVKGALSSNNTSAEYTESANNGVLSFDTGGFTVGNDGNYVSYNSSGQNIVAWCWDAGSGSPVSNTDGTITSTVKANQATGFSIVTYTGTGANATVGHGLGAEPKMIIAKRRDAIEDWPVYHVSQGPNKYGYLDLTNAFGTDSIVWQNVTPTSSLFSIGTSSTTNASSGTYVAYCFAEIEGFSKFGSYTGNGSADGPLIETGFRPAFFMTKCTSTSSDWRIVDGTRNIDNPVVYELNANSSAAETTYSNGIDFNSNSVKIRETVESNTSGETYIYMAFADTRDAQWNFDASGNKNNWNGNNINSNAEGESTYDLMTDVPTLTSTDAANYCTMNPLSLVSPTTLANGNLDCVTGTTGGGGAYGTIAFPSSGKFYFEYVLTATSGTLSDNGRVGIASSSSVLVSYLSDGKKQIDGTQSAYGASWTTNDVIGVAVNIDSGSVTFYKNNTSQGSISYTIAGKTMFPYTEDGSGSISISSSWNFGQRPFAYTPPAGFKSLNTYNLPDSTIEDGSQYFNTVLYTGDGSNGKSITGVGFQTDFNWTKSRSSGSYSHQLSDAVRGFTKYLYSNATNAEGTDASNHIQSVNADGYVINSGASFNASGVTYVAWNWKANGSGVSNTDGSITSTVSANTTAGFSIMTYTGNGTDNATIGHGLGAAPKMLIWKPRNATTDWMVWHAGLSGYNYDVRLNTTTQETTGANPLNNTAPSSSVVTLRNQGDVNGVGNDIVCYAFAEVEGYSKFGSYTGNGSADGPFVYLGFRPAFVMFKRTDTSNYNWYLVDTKRDSYNVMGKWLYPSLSAAETADSPKVDSLSNGFKLRFTDGATNANGGTYIYMAFAENPTKYALAR